MNRRLEALADDPAWLAWEDEQSRLARARDDGTPRVETIDLDEDHAGQTFLGDPHDGRLGLMLLGIERELRRGAQKRREDGCDFGVIGNLAGKIARGTRDARVREAAEALEGLADRFISDVADNGLCPNKDRGMVGALRRQARVLRGEMSG